MVDIRGSSLIDKTHIEIAVDSTGRLIFGEQPYEYVIPITAVAVSTTTTMAKDFKGRKLKLLSVELKWSAAPTTAENVTIDKISAHGTTQYDVNILTRDPSVGAITSLIYMPDKDYFLSPGDEIKVAYTNTDTKVIAGVIVVQAV